MNLMFFITCVLGVLGALASIGTILICIAEIVRKIGASVYERKIQTLQLARIIDDMTHCDPAFGYGVLMGMGCISESDWPNMERALRCPPGTMKRCYDQLQKNE